MFSKIEDALKDLKDGKIICIADSPDEENEIDFCMAAEFVTPEAIYEMARFGSGLICVPMTKHYAWKYDFPPMVEHNQDKRLTNFTVSFDGWHAATGISAKERAETILLLCDDYTQPEEFRRPGHCFGLVAKDGGVLERAGHTEASVDLCKLAGLKPIAVICEILKNPYEMLTVNDWLDSDLSQKYKLVCIAALKKYIRDKE